MRLPIWRGPGVQRPGKKFQGFSLFFRMGQFGILLANSAISYA
jgi:hypothetical protein